MVQVFNLLPALGVHIALLYDSTYHARRRSGASPWNALLRMWRVSSEAGSRLGGGLDGGHVAEGIDPVKRRSRQYPRPDASVDVLVETGPATQFESSPLPR